MSIQTISAPGEQAISVSVQPGNKVKFNFETSAVAFDRQDNNLIIFFEDGGHVEIGDFFLVDGTDGALPILQLQDGTEVESASFFPNVNALLDISVATGPASVQQGSGLSDFAASVGDLIGGVGRLDSMKTDTWKSGLIRF